MNHRVPFLILTAGLFAGCSPTCGAWEDVEVSEGLGTTEQRDAIEYALATFAEWTGREETCVSEVVLVDTLESNGIPVAGSYSSLFRRVSVVADEPFVEDVVLHELCHALDDEEGWPSLSGGDLFDTTGLNQLLYDTPTLRMAEAFARICAEGPVLPAMWRQLEDTCDADIATDDVAFVHEVAFAAFDSDEDFRTFGYGVDRADVGDPRPEGPIGAQVVAGGGDPIVLDSGFAADETEVPVSPVLYALDPATGAVVDRLNLEPNAIGRDDRGQPAITTRTLVGSTQSALVYQFVGTPAAWRVQTDPIRLEEVTLPTLVEGIRPIFEDAGHVWAYVPTDAGDILARIDLVTGDVRSVAPPESLTAGQLDDVYVDALGALATYGTLEGVVVAELDLEGSVVTTHTIPLPGARVGNVVRLPDESALVTLAVNVGMDGSYTLPVRLDLTTGGWSVPDGDCDSIGARWSRVGDEVWYAYQDTDAEGYQAVVAKLTVDP